jgi:membrane protease YdiL (CAAX protease family)
MEYTFKNNVLFKFLNQSEYYELLPCLSQIETSAGETIITENSTDIDIFIIIKGSLNLIKMGKKEHIIATLYTNEYFGEMAVIDQNPRSVSVVAASDCKLLKIDMTRISTAPEYQIIYKKLLQSISATISSRLRFNNELKVVEMEKKLLFGYFIFMLLTVVSIYNLMQVSVFRYFTGGDGTTVSFFTITFFSVSCFLFVIKSKLGWSEFGFSRHQLGRKCLQAILYTLPIMALAVMIKIGWLMWKDIPVWGNIFSPDNLFISMHKPFDLTEYLILMFVYALFCIPQEFVGRGVFQTVFTKFLNKPSPWGVIIVSNLVFAAVHIHKSFIFALAAFIPGLFLGYLFYKQQSVISVSISHALIGIWVVFIIGLTF